MGTTAYGGKGSKGSEWRPVGTASCRREQHTMATCQNPVGEGYVPMDPPPMEKQKWRTKTAAWWTFIQGKGRERQRKRRSANWRRQLQRAKPRHAKAPSPSSFSTSHDQGHKVLRGEKVQGKDKVSGQRPTGATSFRPQSMWALCQIPTHFCFVCERHPVWPCTIMLRRCAHQSSINSTILWLYIGGQVLVLSDTAFLPCLLF